MDDPASRPAPAPRSNGAPARRPGGAARHGRVRVPTGPLAARRQAVREGADAEGPAAYAAAGAIVPTLRPRSRGDAAVAAFLITVLLGLMALFLWDTYVRLLDASPAAMAVYIALLAGTAFAFLLFAASLLIHVAPVMVGLRAPARPAMDPEREAPRGR